MNYQRLLIEWRRINNLKEPDLIISRSRLKYIRYSEEWLMLHKEGYSSSSIAKMYRVGEETVKAVFNEASYEYANKKGRSTYYLAAPIWHAHMQQGLTVSQVADIYGVKEGIVNRQMMRFNL